MKLLSPSISVLAASVFHLIAADTPKQGWNPDTTFPPLSPADAIKTIEVPKGYHLQPILRPNGKASGSIRGVAAATTVGATGYTVEMMIPLTEKNFPARQWQRDRPIKLSLLIHDSDDPRAEAPRKALGWNVSPDLKNSEDTSGWATLILDETKP